MKKLALLIGTAAMVFAGCTKEMPGTDPTVPQDVIFTNAITGGLKGLKSGNPQDCSNKAGTYARVVIDGQTYTPAVFTVNGSVYTQAIKLAPGDHTVSTFVIMDDKGTPVLTDDVIVRAAPESSLQANYTAFVNKPLPFSFVVNSFEKLEQNIEVLCFEDANFQEFGFTWFKPVEVRVQHKWFFGDFCTKFYLDYAGSAYASQSHGLQLDMPAIFKIEVLRDNNLDGTYETSLGSFSNIDYYGEGKPLSIMYSDRTGVVDQYELKLSVYVKVGATFDYKYMKSLYFTDNGEVPTQNGTGPGADGVYDFVLGNCNAQQADFAFAPYMNLPETSDLVVSIPNATGRKSYVNMAMSNFKIGGIARTGFDILPGILEGFCINKHVNIYVGTTYSVKVYSTLLDPTTLPAQVSAISWNKVNWLVNHLEQFTGYTWSDLQQALWKIENPTGYNGEGDPGGGVPAVDFNNHLTMAYKMWNAATTYGNGYVPLPGGWAAVATINSTTDLIQCLFTIVDP